MKNRIVIILFSIMFVLMFQAVCAGFQKTKIAVLDFKVLGKGHTDTDVGYVFTNQLISALKKDGRFEIVEPDDIAVGNNFKKDLLIPKQKGAKTILVSDKEEFEADITIENIHSLKEAVDTVSN